MLQLQPQLMFPSSLRQTQHQLQPKLQHATRLAAARQVQVSAGDALEQDRSSGVALYSTI
jgi:hypothetical protein